MRYNHWSKDMNDSIIAIEKIKSVISPNMVKGKIHSIENSDNEILVLLDRKSGINYIREDAQGLQGIAARVQFGQAYNSFTVRYKRHTGTKTEYEKRIEQIQNGYFYPFLTLQAYFDNRTDMNLFSLAIVRTIDLYDFIDKHPEYIENKFSDNEFMVIYWAFLKRESYKILILDNQ